LDTGSIQYASIDLLVSYPDGSEGVIQDLNTTTGVITVGSRTGVGLSAVNAGETLAIRSSIEGDGMDWYGFFLCLPKNRNYYSLQLRSVLYES
jgi:hypothetical protein